MLTQTEQEMRQVIEVVQNFDPNQARQAGYLIGTRPVYIVGEGSSILFPGEYAKRKARELGLRNKADIVLASEIDADQIEPNAFVILNSNSGETEEVVSLAKKLKEKPAELYGITSNPDSTLAQLCDTYILTCGPEEVDPATKSVFEQALFLRTAMNHQAGVPSRLGYQGEDIEQLIQYMEHNLSMPTDALDLLAQPGSNQFYILDRGSGVASELSLKIAEILGIKAQPTNNLLFHGKALEIGQDDVIYVADTYDEETMQRLERLAAERKAKLITPSDLETQVMDGYEEFCMLTRGWKFVMDIAHSLGINPDDAQVLRYDRST